MNVPLLLRSSVLAALLGAALSAHALSILDGSLTVTVTRPAAGKALATLSGTLDATTPGETVAQVAVSSPVGPGGYLLAIDPAAYGADSNATFAGVAADGTYTGPLFAFDVTPDAPLGTYGPDAFGGGMFSYDSSIAGQPGAHGTFTVQVVPEPSALAALGLGAVAVLRRRRRA